MQRDLTGSASIRASREAIGDLRREQFPGYGLDCLFTFPGYNLEYVTEIQAMTWKRCAMLSSVKRTARRRLDEKLGGLHALRRTEPPPKGWLRAIRDALGMSGTQFARRLGVSWQSMDDLEKSEAAGTIGLETLRRAAAALDCTLVYAIVPTRSLETLVDERAQALARAALARVDQTMRLEDQRVTHIKQDELVEDYIRDHLRDRDLWDTN